MNLIEILGLEKCREIVNNAPELASFYIPSKGRYTRLGSVLLDGAISLRDIRTAIAEHDRRVIWLIRNIKKSGFLKPSE